MTFLGNVVRWVLRLFGWPWVAPRASNGDAEAQERAEWNAMLDGMTPEQMREAISKAREAIKKR